MASRNHRGATGRMPRAELLAAGLDAIRLRREQPEGAGMSIERGDLAPEIDLPDDEGNRWRLSEQRGRPTVVIFHRHLA